MATTLLPSISEGISSDAPQTSAPVTTTLSSLGTSCACALMPATLVVASAAQDAATAQAEADAAAEGTDEASLQAALFSSWMNSWSI